MDLRERGGGGKKNPKIVWTSYKFRPIEEVFTRPSIEEVFTTVPPPVMPESTTLLTNLVVLDDDDDWAVATNLATSGHNLATSGHTEEPRSSFGFTAEEETTNIIRPSLETSTTFFPIIDETTVAPPFKIVHSGVEARVDELIFR